MYQPAIGRSSHISAKRFYSNEFITNLFETTMVLLTGIPLYPKVRSDSFPTNLSKVRKKTGNQDIKLCGKAVTEELVFVPRVIKYVIVIMKYSSFQNIRNCPAHLPIVQASLLRIALSSGGVVRLISKVGESIQCCFVKNINMCAASYLIFDVS